MPDTTHLIHHRAPTPPNRTVNVTRCSICGRPVHGADVHPCCAKWAAKAPIESDCPACRASDESVHRPLREPTEIDGPPPGPRIPSKLEPFRPTGEYDLLAGAVCICPPQCTDKIYGDGPRDCDTDCIVCQIMAGRPYVVEPRGGRRG